MLTHQTEFTHENEILNHCFRTTKHPLIYCFIFNLDHKSLKLYFHNNYFQEFYDFLNLLPCIFVISFLYYMYTGGHRGHDHMVVGFTTICAISAYHHSSCEFESRSFMERCTWYNFVSDLWQVSGFFQVLRLPLSIKLTTTT